MLDNNASPSLYPTDTPGLPGNVVDAFPYYVLVKNVQNLVNSGGATIYGYGGSQVDPTLISQTQISQAIASYNFLSRFFNCSFAGNNYTLTTNQLNTGSSFGLPFQLPFAIQTGMEFAFVASNTNVGGDTLAITGLSPSYPILSSSVSSYGNPINAGDIVAGNFYRVIFSSILNSGNPAFLLQSSTLSIATPADVTAGTDNIKAITSYALKNSSPSFLATLNINPKYGNSQLTLSNIVNQSSPNKANLIVRFTPNQSSPSIYTDVINSTFVDGNLQQTNIPNANLIGNATATTLPVSNNSTQIATTEYVNNLINMAVNNLYSNPLFGGTQLGGYLVQATSNTTVSGVGQFTNIFNAVSKSGRLSIQSSNNAVISVFIKSGSVIIPVSSWQNITVSETLPATFGPIDGVQIFLVSGSCTVTWGFVSQ